MDNRNRRCEWKGIFPNTPVFCNFLVCFCFRLLLAGSTIITEIHRQIFQFHVMIQPAKIFNQNAQACTIHKSAVYCYKYSVFLFGKLKNPNAKSWEYRQVNHMIEDFIAYGIGKAIHNRLFCNCVIIFCHDLYPIRRSKNSLHAIFTNYTTEHFVPFYQFVDRFFKGIHVQIAGIKFHKHCGCHAAQSDTISAIIIGTLHIIQWEWVISMCDIILIQPFHGIKCFFLVLSIPFCHHGNELFHGRMSHKFGKTNVYMRFLHDLIQQLHRQKRMPANYKE